MFFTCVMESFPSLGMPSSLSLKVGKPFSLLEFAAAIDQALATVDSPRVA
jgi:hypothetical protein